MDDDGCEVPVTVADETVTSDIDHLLGNIAEQCQVFTLSYADACIALTLAWT